MIGLGCPNFPFWFFQMLILPFHMGGHMADEEWLTMRYPRSLVTCHFFYLPWNYLIFCWTRGITLLSSSCGPTCQSLGFYRDSAKVKCFLLLSRCILPDGPSCYYFFIKTTATRSNIPQLLGFISTWRLSTLSLPHGLSRHVAWHHLLFNVPSIV